MRKLIAIFCVILLLAGCMPALADFSNAPVLFTARNTVALKLRRDATTTSTGVGSIPKDSTVYILEKGPQWCRVRTERTEGYVLTRYLTDFEGVEQEDGTVPQVSALISMERANTAEPVMSDTEYGPIEYEASPNAVPGFRMAEDNFIPMFKASTVKATVLYREPNGKYIGNIAQYKEVIVGENSENGWSLIRYNNSCYYIETDALFKWDRIQPYAGDIPGLDIWTNLVFVKNTTHITSTTTGEELKTVNPGAGICAGEVQEDGSYILPYYREYGRIDADDVAYVMHTVPWQDAQPGDLISLMTTFYAVGKSTLQYQGRNWNIRLACTLISGTVLQPGQVYDQNKTIGPYAKSTGYKEAPIMSQTKLTGYGGGTCETNSTFYVANMQVPILVTHRRVHANVGMYYIRKGFDAAVGGGDINLQLINTLPYAIRYQCFVSDGMMTVCIFRA